MPDADTGSNMHLTAAPAEAVAGLPDGADAGTGATWAAPAQDVRATLEERVRAARRGAEVIRHDGGQARYPLLIGVE